ncbi:MAG: translation initiation factor IF-3 [Phycisphaeraceae bacterium]|nr:translation initiation factor IF-3 [Phycisphaeraceae bacterium]
MIRISPIRLIGPDNEQIGVIETPEALRMAVEHGLDLVEVVPDARPPVCKIMDYGKHKYDLSKKEQKSRASSRHTELKEIRLGRTTKIDPHDVQIRIDQARRFLIDGHKVQVTQRYRGREMAHKQIGMENLHKFVEALADIARVEIEPRWVGRQTSLVLAPDKAKIDSVKRKRDQEKAKAAQADEAAADQPAQADAHVQQGEKAKKPSGDQRTRNPVDSEIDALLGG